MKKLLPVFGILFTFLAVTSCKKETASGVETFPLDVLYYTDAEEAILNRTLNLELYPPSYKIVLPSHLANSGLFARQVKDEKAVLGRVLFYDKSLSSNGKISCGSCHKQEIGFADNTPTSKGVEDRQGTRNSIALASVANFSAYYGTDLNGSGAIRFFWDNRAATAKDQAKGSLANHDEMNMNMAEVVRAIKTKDYYAPLFKKAFVEKENPSESDIINTMSDENILDAISSFVDAMGSYSSKFDKEAARATGTSYNTNAVELDFSGFSAAENRGKALYQTNCAGCHSPVMGRPLFNYANNGLDGNFTSDLGVGGVAEFQSESMSKGAFKVPTLRNIALTAPYMHDGRFANLEAVIEHYSTGIKNSPTLSTLLLNNNSGSPKRMNFTETQKADLLAFLGTMTDNTITNKNDLLIGSKFSDPFK
jgi:cytochrome c peroxidase